MMKLVNSLRFRILAACLIFGLIANVIFNLFLFVAFETGEDTMFNWQIANEAEQYRSLYLDHFEVLKRLNTVGTWKVGNDSQLLAYLGHDALTTESLSDSPYIDVYVDTSQQGFEIFEYTHDQKVFQIVRSPLPQSYGLDTFFYYLIDISQFDRGQSDTPWKIALSIVVCSLVMLGLAWITGLQVSHFVIAPLTRLKQDLDTLDFSSEQQLAGDYYHDEVGAVARYINKLLLRISRMIDREKQFTRDASHELRTPITNIAMASEILQLAVIDNPGIQRPLQRITRATEDMKNLIESFLQLSREESICEATQTISLHTTVEQSLDRHQYLVAHKPVTLHNQVPTSVTASLPPVIFSIMLDNLVRNACQYTDSGEVTIFANDSRLWIQDSGPGFKDEAIPRLLKPWEKAHVSGLGLGLSIVARICQARHWRLEINNRKPEGANTPSGAVIKVLFSQPVHNAITN
ncbi:sensor histidine kinase [Endozoicomonas acroporae]|uniref:sensor histidine kinase n=1 Tax=Endozoicomonas acroporae TaxID=1701104 RepID=UPI003D78C17D